MSSFPNIYNPFLYGGLYGLGWGFPALPRVVEEKDVQQPAKPTGKPQTNYQQVMGLYGIGSADDAWLRGYADAPPGNDMLWRLMARQPTIALARACTIGPVQQASRTVEVRQKPGQAKKRKGGPITGDGIISSPEDKRSEFCNDVLEPLLPDLIRDMLGALTFAHKPFETVWQPKGGQVVIIDFIPLRNEITQVMIAGEGGGFLGLRYGNVELWGADAFNYANDPINRNWLGNSRMQNIKEEWWMGLQDMRRLGALADKAVGICMAIYGPVGTGMLDSNGNEINGPAMGNKIAVELVKQRPVWMPNDPVWRDPEKNTDVEYLKAWAIANEATKIKLEQFDWGDTSPMARAILERRQARKSEFFEGWLRPAREALEGQTGTKAEAGVHGQIGTMDCDMVHADICRAISRGPINDLLERNFGESTRDSVYLDPAPLIDSKKQDLIEYLKVLMTNPEIQIDSYEKMDSVKVADTLGIPIKDGVDANAKLVRAVQPAPNGPAGNGGAPINGNGNANGKAVNGKPGKRPIGMSRLEKELVKSVRINRLANSYQQGETVPNVAPPKKEKTVTVKRGANGDITANIVED